ncbi:hypothetical protein [Marinicellulosiphila megalodicopiae]|uniref:hypothetical protein n=1 Tax=Marinicellulosiphila megalodicopiae TaxID=2724896 RepID=UPI003BB1E52C
MNEVKVEIENGNRLLFWVLGLLLFIPINLYVGFGLFFSGDEVVRNIKYDRFSLFNDGMTIGFLISFIFIMFNLFYFVYSLRNLDKFKGVWYLIIPILISFIEFAGCIPVLAKINFH